MDHNFYSTHLYRDVFWVYSQYEKSDPLDLPDLPQDVIVSIKVFRNSRAYNLSHHPGGASWDPGG